MKYSRWIASSVLAVGLSLGVTEALAQARVTKVPDAQVESDVLKALAANPKLADQTISSSTVYGTVTLSGNVRDEESRKLAESIVSRTPGVQKVVDELTLGSDANANAQNSENGAAGADSNSGSNPLLQSDGTLAPSPQQQTPAQNTEAIPQRPTEVPQQRAPRQQSGQQPYDPYAQSDGAQAQQPPPPPPGLYGPPYRRPYRQPPPYGPPSGYQQPPSSPVPYGAQVGGQPVAVPSGSLLRVRINQGLDSKHTQPGTVFDAVVLNDVVAGGFVAIPRGAAVQGTVLDAQQAGALKGRGELALQLTQVTLAGKTFPIASDVWSNVGGDKTARTVNSAIGLGAVGAIIGGVAGGGAGAAIGAGVGGAAGVGASAASGGGQAFIPAEAILTFHLTQQADLTSVSQAEMDRLGYGVPVGAQPTQPRYTRPLPYGYGYPIYYSRYPRPYPYAYPY